MKFSSHLLLKFFQTKTKQKTSKTFLSPISYKRSKILKPQFHIQIDRPSLIGIDRGIELTVGDQHLLILQIKHSQLGIPGLVRESEHPPETLHLPMSIHVLLI